MRLNGLPEHDHSGEGLGGPGINPERVDVGDSGLSVESEGGEWVAKDEDGNTVLRYDSEAESWVMDSLSTDEMINRVIRNKGYNKGIKLESVTIPDNDVATVDSEAFSTVFINAIAAGRGVGQFTTSFDGISTLNATNITNQGNTVLDGTTGPDGTLNVAVDDNTLYLENRFGQETEYSTFQLGV